MMYGRTFYGRLTALTPAAVKVKRFKKKKKKQKKKNNK